MQEVTKAVTELQASSVGDCDCDLQAFQRASERWAVFALQNFTGEHLIKALDVSRTMAEYCAWHMGERKAN